MEILDARQALPAGAGTDEDERAGRPRRLDLKAQHRFRAVRKADDVRPIHVQVVQQRQQVIDDRRALIA
jgi:hypothetical protein